jgi:hypothetical protein
MALIDDLDQFPSGPLVRSTRSLIDLALSMSGEYSGNSGITSNDEDGGPNARPLNDGGHELWKFIRRARDKCWERAGLDPAVLNCPEDAKDIHFGDSSSPHINDTGPSPSFPPDLNFEYLPDTTSTDDWSFLAHITSPNWGDMGGGDLGLDSTML